MDEELGELIMVQTLLQASILTTYERELQDFEFLQVRNAVISAIRRRRPVISEITLIYCERKIYQILQQYNESIAETRNI